MKTEPNQTTYPHNTSICQPEFGLTKREYFAAMAMQGILASAVECGDDDLALNSVRCADALITHLNKSL